MMKIRYDKQEDALYIRFHDAPYAESDEVRKGVIVDYDERGRVVGLEILKVSENVPFRFLEDIQKQRIGIEVHEKKLVGAA